MAQEAAAENELAYGILVNKDPDILSRVVSVLMRDGWKLHGELKLQTIADDSSLTFARLVYIQAMYREVSDG